MTETQTVDLAAWLTRIWDEEERATQGAIDVSQGWWLVIQAAAADPSWAKRYGNAYQHLAQSDPRIALARIAADRKILELHTGAHECPELKTGTYPDDWPEDAPYGKAGFPWRHASNEYFEDETCPTQRLLASPYKGREGWQEEWG